MTTDSSILKSKSINKSWLQFFAMFMLCFGTLGASAQNHPKEILEIPPMELINPIERVAIEADHPSAVLNTKVVSRRILN